MKSNAAPTRFERLMFGREMSPARLRARVYGWNMCASLLYAIQSAVLLLIVTRLWGLYVAGRFSIYFVTTQMLSTLALYSMRHFQVSDVHDEYSFRTYYSSRIITCAVMAVVGMGYALVSKRTAEGLVVVGCLVLYRVMDGIEDVVHAQVQKEGRLDAASVGKAARVAAAVALFTVAGVASDSLIIASVALAAASLIVLYAELKVLIPHYSAITTDFSKDKVAGLLVACFPLMAGAFLYSYLINIPKYAIERVLSSDMQTIFNILFMPVFLVNVLSQFIFVPMVATMSIWWEKRDKRTLVRSIMRQTVIILGIAALVALAGYVIGYKILGIVYAVDLTGYRSLLAGLLMMGGMAALTVFLGTVLTIMRRQKIIVITYAVVDLIGWRISDSLVKKSGLAGAGMIYGILVGAAIVIFAVAIGVCMHGAKRRDTDEG